MDTLDQSISDNSFLNEKSKQFLSETAKWTKFISIIGFIGIGLMVIASLFMGTYMSGFGGQSPFPPILITIVYIAMAALYSFPVLYLYRFSDKMKNALANEDEDGYTSAFENLKSHYKVIGILTAVFLGLYVLSILFGLVAGLVM